jgi:hypothetical protein
MKKLLKPIEQKLGLALAALLFFLLVSTISKYLVPIEYRMTATMVNDIILAVLSIVGMYYTIHSFNATHIYFHTFEQFHDHAVKLMEDTSEKVYMVYFTPNVGIMTTNAGESYKRFMQKLKEVKDDEAKIEFKGIFLDPISLRDFYGRFQKNFSKKWGNAYWQDCLFFTKFPPGNKMSRFKFCSYENFSTTFVLSESKAIVMNPLYLPHSLENDYQGNVSFIGQVITDRVVVERLHNIFQKYWNANICVDSSTLNGSFDISAASPLESKIHKILQKVNVINESDADDKSKPSMLVDFVNDLMKP